MDKGLSQLGHTYLIVWFTYTGYENIGSVSRKFKKEENKMEKFLQTLYVADPSHYLYHNGFL